MLEVADIVFFKNYIYTDENGNFSETLLLQDGYNIIQFTAKDKFNREVMETLELVYR